MNQPTTRMERKREETRRKVIAAALKLFQQVGLDAATMEQIAEEADIAKGTLYHYFPVKEAILDAYIQQSFRERNPERIQRLRSLPDTHARLTYVLSDLMGGIRRQQALFERYFIYRIQQMVSLRPDGQSAGGFSEMGAELIRLGWEGGDLRRDLSGEVLQALFEFTFIKVAQAFYALPDSADFPAVIAQYVELFLRGAQS